MEKEPEFSSARTAEVALGAFFALLAIGVIKVIAQGLME